MSRKTKHLILGLPLAIALAVLAGCGDSDDTLDSGAPAGATESPAAGLPTDGDTSPSDGDDDGNGDASQAMAIGGDASGESLTVTAGTTVTFVNESDEVETVTINGVNESGDLEPGESFEYTFAQPGEYLVTSDYNLAFRATVMVV